MFVFFNYLLTSFRSPLSLLKYSNLLYICLLLSSSFLKHTHPHTKAHSVRVSVGDRVKAGQVLCLSGDAGYTYIHMHFQETCAVVVEVYMLIFMTFHDKFFCF
jgi:hypothetical protein